jgi:hypothetical protein
MRWGGCSHCPSVFWREQKKTDEQTWWEGYLYLLAIEILFLAVARFYCRSSRFIKPTWFLNNTSPITLFISKKSFGVALSADAFINE